MRSFPHSKLAKTAGYSFTTNKTTLMEHDKTGSSSPPSRVCLIPFVLTILLLLLLLLPFLTLAQVDTYEFAPSINCLSRGGNFTANSTFAANLNRLVSSLSSLPPNPYGFYNVSVGETAEDRVNAIALCRREVTRENCLGCIQTAARNLTQQCPERKEALVWYTHCMFRYSNRSIFGRTDTSPTIAFVSGHEITGNRDEFVRLRTELLNRLKGIAAAGGPRRKYAQGNGSAPTSYRGFYGTAQCTPDLSEQDCDDCLVYGFGNIQRCCDGKAGLRWFCPSCNFRIETSRFYELEADLAPDPQITAPAPPPASPADRTNERTGKGKGSSSIVIAIVIPVVVVTIFLACLCLFLKVKKRKPEEKFEVLGESPLSGKDGEDELTNSEFQQFDFGTIKAATSNFSPENELGRGGFGAVYKGILSDGQKVAVKRLLSNSGQGNEEFKNEVLLVARLQHRNLVRLLGFCIEGDERLLVYEFIKNTSLDSFIFDPDKRPLLDWGMRHKMIGGVARGLLYLHEDSRYRIIHRDLKASNILLDDAMTPKIADFGLAKLFEADQTTQKFTNRVAGTYGYMAPEYAMHGQFSVKTDVFSFGVLVLEIISGKRNNEFQNGENVEGLLSYVWRSWREDTVLNIIDPSLTSGSRNEILRCIHIGLLCVQENPASRPTMASVVLMLNSYSLTLQTPLRPAFVVDNPVGSNVSPSTEQNSRATESLNDASITELSPR